MAKPKEKEIFEQLMKRYLPGRGITEKVTISDRVSLERYQTLEYYKDQVYRCGKCGQCRYTYQNADLARSCPSGELRGFESYYLGGKNLLLWGLTSGRLIWSEGLAEILYHCTLCGNCTQQCQLEGIHTYALEWLAAAREEAVEKGYGPMPEQRRYGQHVEEEHNPYVERHTDRLNWLGDRVGNFPEKAETVYFVGCTSSYRQKNIAIATFDILSGLGKDFTVMRDEWCCGSPLIWTGQVEIARKCAEHNVEAIEETGAELVVTSCAGCYRILKEVYREKFGLDYGFEVMHSPVYVLDLVKRGELTLEKPFGKRVTYHDPCHIGRHMGIYEQPRELLRSIPGIELVEMPRNRHNAWCCGAGGGVKSSFKELASFAATERLREALETGAEVLSSACPFCYRNLSDAKEESKMNIQILDLMELVQMSMRT
ncbi:MAG: (Fe-S)-binding protein [Candidatus Freyarchaeota archaeon]